MSALYFITDAHLGSGHDSDSREKSLCHLLDDIRKDADMVVFLGDMFDFWFTYRHVVPRGGIRLLGKMAEMADQGIRLHYFVGNHDMWLFDYLTDEMDITMHEEPALLEYDGKRFLCGHGDGLGHLDHGYDLLRLIFRSRFNQRAFSILPEWLTFGIARGWSGNSRKRHDDAEAHYLGDEREGIVLYCRQQMEQQEMDYCVFGHRHTPLEHIITSDKGKAVPYVNAGDWLTHRTYARYSHGEGLRLVSRDKG